MPWRCTVRKVQCMSALIFRMILQNMQVCKYWWCTTLHIIITQRAPTHKGMWTQTQTISSRYGEHKASTSCEHKRKQYQADMVIAVGTHMCNVFPRQLLRWMCALCAHYVLICALCAHELGTPICTARLYIHLKCKTCASLGSALHLDTIAEALRSSNDTLWVFDEVDVGFEDCLRKSMHILLHIQFVGPLEAHITGAATMLSLICDAHC